MTRFTYTDLNTLLIEAYELTKTLDSEGVYTWFTYAKEVFRENSIDQPLQFYEKKKSDRVRVKRKVYSYYETIFRNKIRGLQNKR